MSSSGDYEIARRLMKRKTNDHRIVSLSVGTGLTDRESALSCNRAEASVRGTFKGIEVKCRGGEQAHRWVGSLKLLQDFHYRQRAL
jgi:hypothetical protein